MIMPDIVLPIILTYQLNIANERRYMTKRSHIVSAIHDWTVQKTVDSVSKFIVFYSNMTWFERLSRFSKELKNYLGAIHI